MLGLVRSSYVDPVTAMTIDTLGKPGSDVSHQYVSSSSWSSSGQLAVCVDIASQRCVLGSYDWATGDDYVIEQGVFWGSPAVGRNDVVYYGRRDNVVWAHDLATRTSAPAIMAPVGTVIHDAFYPNNACTRIGLYWNPAGTSYSSGTAAGWGDLVTGALNPVVPVGHFSTPYPVANHVQVNPVYDDQLFFAHEGLSQMPDRIWTADAATRTVRNLYVQQRTKTGDVGEYVGHEVWSPDGEQLYFVRYQPSPLGANGVYAVSRDGVTATLVDGQHDYWHVSPSPSGRYLAADTATRAGVSDVVLIDLTTGCATVLARGIAASNHPAHPHPTFSRDSRYVTFTALESGRCQVRVVDLAQM